MAARRPRSDPWALGLLAPAGLVMALVMLFPAGYVLWLSLTRRTPGRPDGFAGLAHYREMLADERFYTWWRPTCATWIGRRPKSRYARTAA